MYVGYPESEGFAGNLYNAPYMLMFLCSMLMCMLHACVWMWFGMLPLRVCAAVVWLKLSLIRVAAIAYRFLCMHKKRWPSFHSIF